MLWTALKTIAKWRDDHVPFGTTHVVVGTSGKGGRDEDGARRAPGSRGIVTALGEVASTSVAPRPLVAAIPAVAGAVLITPQPSRDTRGFLSSTLDDACLEEAGVDPSALRHDYLSRTRHAVVRGLNLAWGVRTGLLVRCSRGAVAFAMVDLRPGSPTFRAASTVELHSDPPRTLYVPPGCAHGFQSLTEPADVTYRVGTGHRWTGDVTIAWDDPDLGIAWPLRPAASSMREDRGLPLAAVLTSPG